MAKAKRGDKSLFWFGKSARSKFVYFQTAGRVDTGASQMQKLVPCRNGGQGPSHGPSHATLCGQGAEQREAAKVRPVF